LRIRARDNELDIIILIVRLDKDLPVTEVVQFIQEKIDLSEIEEEEGG